MNSKSNIKKGSKMIEFFKKLFSKLFGSNTVDSIVDEGCCGNCSGSCSERVIRDDVDSVLTFYTDNRTNKFYFAHKVLPNVDRNDGRTKISVRFDYVRFSNDTAVVNYSDTLSKVVGLKKLETDYIYKEKCHTVLLKKFLKDIKNRDEAMVELDKAININMSFYMDTKGIHVEEFKTIEK